MEDTPCFRPLPPLAARNLCVSYQDEQVVAGTYHLDCQEYFVMVTLAEPASILITDKLIDLGTAPDKVLQAANQLNVHTLSGVHQLHFYRESVVYVYRCPCRPDKIHTNADFCQVVENGIREFDQGFVMFRSCFE